MSDSIFLIHPDHHLVEAVATPYALEKELQERLAEHVQLIPGAQIDRADPPRWHLVKRQAERATRTKRRRLVSVPMNQISDSQLTQLLMLLDDWCADTRKYKPSDQPADVAEDEGA